MENLSHYIKVYDDVFTRQFCQSFIDRFENLTSATSPSMRVSEYRWPGDYRRFLEVNVKQDPAFADIVTPYYGRILEVYNHYKEAIGSQYFPSKYSLEDARMKRYQNDDYEQFGWHVDIGDKASSSRYLAMFTYLNDVEHGGETEFKSNSNFTIKPKCGTIVVFPPYFMFEHCGRKPISNNKYILSTYLHYV